MTCIVGIEQGDTVWIGGDSAGVGGYSISVRADQKVFENGPMIMGFTSSFRMGQLLRYSLKIPRQKNGQGTMNYLVTDFMDAVRKTYGEKGYLLKENMQEEGGTFLLGYDGCLYVVHGDFQVGRVHCGYNAVGCGDDLALGSLHATAEFDLSPEERIEAALEAAAQHSAGVTGPFVIVKMSKRQSRSKRKKR